jgi:anaerobic ribonucleoside-triphosphate reductase activating protein
MQLTKPLPLRYQGYAIVLQEVPDEISLAFNISGCPYKCIDCHSKNLWEYKGNYLGQDLLKVLSINSDYVTCVCFMGGDYNLHELYNLCRFVKASGLKTAIYSGSDDINIFKRFIDNHVLNYLKIGRYMKEYGGLDNPSTNQIMYKIVDNKMVNINHRFAKPKL